MSGRQTLFKKMGRMEGYLLRALALVGVLFVSSLRKLYVGYNYFVIFDRELGLTVGNIL